MMGAGKSTAGRILAELGLSVIDCDQIVARLYETAEVKDILQSRFGLDVFLPDASVDKKRLAWYVFTHPEDLAWLEQIMWPRVRQNLEIWLFAQGKRGRRVVFVLGSHLAAAGFATLVDELWQITASREQMIERAQAAYHWDRQKAEMRVEHSQDKLLQTARISSVLDNTGNIADLAAQIKTLCRQHGWLEAEEKVSPGRD